MANYPTFMLWYRDVWGQQFRGIPSSAEGPTQWQAESDFEELA